MESKRKIEIVIGTELNIVNEENVVGKVVDSHRRQQKPEVVGRRSDNGARRK